MQRGKKACLMRYKRSISEMEAFNRLQYNQATDAQYTWEKYAPIPSIGHSLIFKSAGSTSSSSTESCKITAYIGRNAGNSRNRYTEIYMNFRNGNQQEAPDIEPYSSFCTHNPDGNSRLRASLYSRYSLQKSSLSCIAGPKQTAQLRQLRGKKG